MLGKEKEKYFRKWISFLIMGLLCLFMAACSEKHNIQEESNRIIRAIENNDMETLEQLLFESRGVIVDEQLLSFFEDTQNKNGGVVKKIIEEDTIKIKKITEESLIYIITTPDLSEMFQDVIQQEKVTEENFEEYIYKYIESAKKIEIEVEVPYSYENGVFKADYSSKEFIEAITGNMINSYQELIQKMILEM